MMKDMKDKHHKAAKAEADGQLEAKLEEKKVEAQDADKGVKKANAVKPAKKGGHRVNKEEMQAREVASKQAVKASFKQAGKDLFQQEKDRAAAKAALKKAEGKVALLLQLG